MGRLNERAPDIVVADDAEFERQAAFARITDRGRNAGVGTGTTTSASTGASRANSAPIALRAS